MSADPFQEELLTHLPRLKGFAYSLTKKLEDAEDLVQDTVVRALAAREQFTLGTNMRAWLCFIARNLFLSGKRRAWRSTEMDDEWAKAIPGNDNQHQSLALKELLEALTYIPPEQAEALLVISEGESYEDAAQQLGCEVGTLKSRVSRARDSLELFFSAA